VEEQDHIVLALVQRPPGLIGHLDRGVPRAPEGPPCFKQEGLVREDVEKPSLADGIAGKPGARRGRKLTVRCSMSIG
jgi:hypothetical protein